MNRIVTWILLVCVWAAVLLSLSGCTIMIDSPNSQPMVECGDLLGITL